MKVEMRGRERGDGRKGGPEFSSAERHVTGVDDAC